MGKEDINYALVEETRPPIYTAMKYWGKKPHNIWGAYIENYTPEKGIYLDPFSGSGVSAFEAVKAGKKVIAFDLNPLTCFNIEVLCSNFDKIKFTKKVNEIINKIQEDEKYKELFIIECPKCGYKEAIVQHAKREKKEVYEIGIICNSCKEKKLDSNGRFICNNKSLIELKDKEVNIPYWYPKKQFPKSQSFSNSFINQIGGNSFSNLWTNRNLYVISKIFDEILKENDENLKKQLLFGFIQSIHLCTKMSVPRREEANRAFSTSWGRSAYLCSSRQMEMNPLLVFKSSCFGKQSVESSLSNIKKYIGKIPKIKYVDYSNKKDRTKSFDIKYGAIDINTLTDYIDEKSIDFIMTDPPYGGLVQYLDLSLIWLVWLEKYNKKFNPNYEAEITINKETQDLATYKSRFQNGIKNLFKVLKDDGKIIFTFHNKNLKIWNAFLNAISLSGFKIEKVIHQQNRRTGESNVANPYGTSATDLYIRCIKSPVTNLKTDKDEFEEFIIRKAIQLIVQRNEPTPYQILFNGLLVEISEAGFDLEDFDIKIESTLKRYVGKIFEFTNNEDKKGGNLWWFKSPEEYIKYPDKDLKSRVEETVISLLRQKVSVTIDDVIGKIFVKYPNGLTPDIRSITDLLKKYADKSGGKWIYKGGEIEEEFTKHTEILFLLNKIGKKLGFETFIGKREQPEKYKGKRLREYTDFDNLKKLNFDIEQRKRIEMIDMLWLDKTGKIRFVIEVENSTNFTSGIQRGSNLSKDIPKLMIIPNKRESEFKRLKDPLFLENFKEHRWKYSFYNDIFRLSSSSNINLEDLNKISEEL
jgi:DNA modification methylase